MSNPLQIMAGLLFVFFLPGYTMVNMLFPRKGELDPEYDIVYRITIGMGLSIVTAILVGFGLNAISSEEHGYVTAGPLWAALLSLTAVFFAAGWFRGAYPWMGMIHPSLYRPPRSAGVPDRWLSDFGKKRRIEKLILEREQLLRDINVFSQRSSISDAQRNLYYRKRTEQARERIAQINTELRKLESGDGI